MRKRLVKFGLVVFELHECTHRQTDILITILHSLLRGEVTIRVVILSVLWSVFVTVL